MTELNCKTGGYNLEGTKAKTERLTTLILLIALAYTAASLKGKIFKSLGQQKYIARLRELKRIEVRHSNFWIGLYGHIWILALDFCKEWMNQIMKNNLNKLSFYQRGLRAMSLMQSVS